MCLPMKTKCNLISGKSGTFAVGLAARREQAEVAKQHEPGDGDDGCELCAAEARVRHSMVYPTPIYVQTSPID